MEEELYETIPRFPVDPNMYFESNGKLISYTGVSFRKELWPLVQHFGMNSPLVLKKISDSVFVDKDGHDINKKKLDAIGVKLRPFISSMSPVYNKPTEFVNDVVEEMKVKVSKPKMNTNDKVLYSRVSKFLSNIYSIEVDMLKRDVFGSILRYTNVPTMSREGFLIGWFFKNIGQGNYPVPDLLPQRFVGLDEYDNVANPGIHNMLPTHRDPEIDELEIMLSNMCFDNVVDTVIRGIDFTDTFEAYFFYMYSKNFLKSAKFIDCYIALNYINTDRSVQQNNHDLKKYPKLMKREQASAEQLRMNSLGARPRSEANSMVSYVSNKSDESQKVVEDTSDLIMNILHLHPSISDKIADYIMDNYPVPDEIAEKARNKYVAAMPRMQLYDREFLTGLLDLLHLASDHINLKDALDPIFLDKKYKKDGKVKIFFSALEQQTGFNFAEEPTTLSKAKQDMMDLDDDSDVTDALNFVDLLITNPKQEGPRKPRGKRQKKNSRAGKSPVVTGEYVRKKPRAKRK